MKMHLQIGEHIAFVTYETSFIKAFFERNYIVLPLNSGDSEISLNIKASYGDPFTNYNVEIKKGTNKLYYRRADYLIETTRDYKQATIHVHDEPALKHALMNFYSAFILHNNWGLLMHSSCVVEEGKAHIFTGRSGAGKSTAAQLSAPRVLLSDEATLVKITPECITVFNSPFRSELEVTGKEISTQLKSIQLLRQAVFNSRKQLKKSDAVLNLMDKVFYWVHGPEETKKIMTLLISLVDKVPVYELHFQKDDTFWELIS
ncbi:hypothetical protein ACFFHF_12310 [Robertmurraya beringensis]|uniref:Uncharacterized protein n=1 Tax=Robertmurraya beringensis TaxID=641660 RepID=A0ABV6KT17_9BACI